MVFVYIRIYFAAKARARRGIKKHPRKTNNEQVSELWLKWALLMCVYSVYTTDETWLKRTQYANIFVCNCMRCMCADCNRCGHSEIGKHCKCKFCHLNEHATLQVIPAPGICRVCAIFLRLKSVRSRHTQRAAFKLQFSANFLCHVRVAATNCCRSTLQHHPPWHYTSFYSRTALCHVRPFLLIWRAHSRWQPLCQGYSTKWHRLAFPLCAAAAVTLCPSA